MKAGKNSLDPLLNLPSSLGFYTVLYSFQLGDELRRFIRTAQPVAQLMIYREQIDYAAEAR
jgi:hypothetical protein